MSAQNLASNPDFVRLQNLQITQTNEIAEFKRTVNNNFREIGKQIELLVANVGQMSNTMGTPKNPDPPDPRGATNRTGVTNLSPPFYQSLVDLDRPCYAEDILKDDSYTPAKNIRVTMPRFDGTDAEGWLFQVRRYFIFNKIPENQKLLLASFHMDGLARKWFAWMEASKLLSDWSSFTTAVLRKFTKLHLTLPGGELSKLSQEGSVSEYRAAFEDLSTRVLGLPEHFILEMFISGLKEEIQSEVVRDKPADLQEAFDLAIFVENQLTRSSKHYAYKPKNSFKQSAYQPFLPKDKTNSTPPVASTTIPTSTEISTKPVFKKLSPAERKERQSKGLCFNCDEKYVPSHKCKGRFFRLAADESCLIEVFDREDEEEESVLVDSPPAVLIPNEGQTEISYHAFEGHISSNTIRLEGFVKCQSISVLVDTGSTHNFLQEEVAATLQLVVHMIHPFQVSTGSGEQLTCSKLCREVEVKIQGTVTKMDLFLLPMTGANMVIGIQGLKLLGPVTFDFSTLSMQFSRNGKTISWVGSSWISDEPLTSGQLKCLVAQSREAYLCYYEKVEDCETITTLQDSTDHFTKIVQEYGDVFMDPTGLPPQRVRSHHIHLEPGSKPVNVRPYRYPQFQKEEIERLVKEMLAQNIIQPSTSPFSSPVLLVKKKDGGYRLCVDYRALNAITVKDKFPIPTVDELLGELKGATIFSKLDLRSGFHQIRVHPSDVEKTAFRTHQGHYEFMVMPFGLTNAPSTFQAVMNLVFAEYLRKFVLIFFDDILVYSSSIESHTQHLQSVFQTLRKNKLLAKLSKCSFGKHTMGFLGHIIAADGIHPDPEKISAMVNWALPTSLKKLRGFLGLTGYYRRFIKNYAQIASPMTDLLKKDSFLWNQEATDSFELLKKAMVSAPVLAFPDFSQQFVVETDASSSGVGAVLLQLNHPISFYSCKITGRLKAASIYVKEMFAITQAVGKWRHYLLGAHFVIRTDHKTLKNLLTQTIQTPEQQVFLCKLLGFNFSIVYKPGKENVVADALSIVYEEDKEEVLFTNHTEDSTGSLFAISASTSNFINELREEVSACPELKQMASQISSGALDPNTYALKDGLILFHQKYFLKPQSPLIPKILSQFHDSPIGGHSGAYRTLRRIATYFWWKGMSKTVKNYVRECIICQKVKSSNQKPQGLLLPLPMPSSVWSDISMDFITDLPKISSQTVIMVVVDRLSKYAHFIPLPTNFNASLVAEQFTTNIVKLHGIPKTIVSDRDKIFTSKFWRELHKLSGTQLHFSSAYHPQTDGQTEVINKILQMYLRSYCHEDPKKWLQLLPWAELWYNTSYQSSIKMSPFKALYGKEPDPIPNFPHANSEVDAVESELLDRTLIIEALKKNLSKAQERMKFQADNHRQDLEFQVGEFVLIKLQPYRQSSLGHRLSNKLGQKYFGPYRITRKINPAAYSVELPEGSRIHNTFHVSKLRKFIGPVDQIAKEPPLLAVDNQPITYPLAIIDGRVMKKAGKLTKQFLVQWSGTWPEDASWIDADLLQQTYPVIQLEDDLFFGGAADVTRQIPHQQVAEDARKIIEREVTPAREDPELDGNPLSNLGIRPTRIRNPPSWIRDYEVSHDG